MSPACQLCKVEGGETREYLDGRHAHQACMDAENARIHAEAVAPVGHEPGVVRVEVALAETKAAAVRFASESLSHLLEDGSGFVVTGRAWYLMTETPPVECEADVSGAVECWHLEVTHG